MMQLTLNSMVWLWKAHSAYSHVRMQIAELTSSEIFTAYILMIYYYCEKLITSILSTVEAELLLMESIFHHGEVEVRPPSFRP